MQKKHDAEWFNDDDFWERFQPIMFDDSRWQEAPDVAEGILHLAGGFDKPVAGGLDKLDHRGQRGSSLSRPLRVLDMCCGFGRISVELCKLGCQVTGIDQSRFYLEAARDEAGEKGYEIEYIEGDIRDFKRKEAFDIAINIYNSFGYFENPADDALFVKNAYDSLKKGGVFIIDVLGKEIAVRDYTEAEWFEKTECLVLTESYPMYSWGSMYNHWILLEHDKNDNADHEGSYTRHEKVWIQRLYAASEMEKLLRDGGFSKVQIYGSWSEKTYDNQARSLIAVARK
ncbi:MAG: class I SAM-dependent methyltransferase [Spirochaetaceae bacterium]|jgi:SAM-dependent methyltransferase|nr:class I SAM-dependent methyltransferase [Spirochaetaceae bacterium]